MTGSEPQTGDVFDVDRIRRLIELMKEHDLREIDLKQEDQQIRLCRNVEEAAPRVYAPLAPAPVAAAPVASRASVAAADDKNVTFIKSPMVGTFYTRPNPKAENFVKVGDRVTAEKTVCIVEAMKTFNEIPAEISGTILAVLVEDGEAVDFGRPLFKVDTSK
ncbi:MAG TPA: acetyl-CoA carboxylase biotin carboxyl carrier protein [Pirellulaceae bacterium]|nr:acetyl-CoA carboxylase biotin carboxyl carrier protein [Pirellulaceae bacterium]